MNRLFYFFVIYMLLSNNLFATHNKAGEIQVKQLDYLQYEAIIKTYTKESSINADRDSLEICWGDGLCEWVQRDGFVSLGNDVKFNTYTSQHSFANEGNYTISMTDRNRNGGIGNINGPNSDNVPFHIETNLEVSSFVNNTPEFLNPPTEFGYVGFPLYHILGAIDREGDSLGYELIVPLQAVGVEVPLYIFPHNVGAPQNTSLTIDPETGLVTWDSPQLQAAYVITIQVTEYRNGNILSTTIRDVQFDIGVPEGFVSANSNIPEDDFIIENGDNLNFNFTIGESSSEELKVSVLGLPFLINNPASVDIPNDFSFAPVEGTISWDVLEEHADLSPYNIFFRIDQRIDNLVYTTYQVVKIIVNADPLNIDPAGSHLSFDIFPNPSHNENVFINLSDQTSVSLTIKAFDNLGRLILENRVYLSGGNFPWNISDLQKGTYFIQVETSDKKVGLKKFVVP